MDILTDVPELDVQKLFEPSVKTIGAIGQLTLGPRSNGDERLVNAFARSAPGTITFESE
ncbi:MAG TPA: hypothetical protein VLE73_00835 [Candidatus Saccharimonadales bacterium]|nr:hypothetical protein [Candidatus Saccharimonadales bacterium]